MDLEILRHSCSHIMASAVKKLHPNAKVAIGPSIDNGFYYDFDIPEGIKIEELAEIEELMKEEMAANEPFIHEQWPAEQAIEFFDKQGEKYKVELIKDLGQQVVSIYKHGDFIDLCRGPHIESTKRVKFFKLLSTSGAYWRGDENKDRLVRIYGTAFATKDELKKYLNNLEEAKKRDHRKLGKDLDLFDIYHDQAGAGLVFYHPKGATVKRIIENWEIDEHIKRGYEVVQTPHIMDQKLWEKSGHLDFYEEYMYSINKDNQNFVLKPMNCPGHILIYKSKTRSFRDLPWRLFELGTVYRFEKTGVLHGLLRVRGFTQDDAHIFCKKEDLYSEIEGVLDFVKSTMDKFGFKEYEAELSTRPDKFIGESSDWDLAENTLEEVLKKKEFNYKINSGDGAFYGPKIDIKLRDAIGREWQCATVQLDYNIPKRFDLTYHATDGSEQRVIMIHRVILGSLERFFATLIEHYAGRFPLWLAPVQVSVININKDVAGYAQKIQETLKKEGFRVDIDIREETLQKKIRTKELLKVPYMVIVGQKEAEQNLISLRASGKKNLGNMSLEDFIDKLKKEEGLSEICQS